MAGKWFGRRANPVQTDRELATTFRRALVCVLEGDHEGAEALITEAVQADSDDFESYRALARLYRQRGEVGRAIRIHQNLLLRRDLEAGGRNLVLAELADDFRTGGFARRAIASYQELLSHDSRNREALGALVELHVEAQDYPEALAMAARLERVERRKDPAREAALWLGLARCEHAEGHHDAARKALKKAVRRDASNAEAQILLGQLLAERGKKKAALAAWRAVAEQGGEAASPAYPKIEASYAALGRARDYEPFLRRLLEERPDDALARMALAATLASRGETDAAVLELRRVLDTNPERMDARVALGRLLLRAERGAEAAKEYAELLELLAGGPEDESPTSGRRTPLAADGEGTD